MDTLAGLLDGPRARGAFLLRSILTPPWSLRIQDEAPLTLVAVVRGDAWITPDHAEAVRLCHRDVAVVRGPDHYTVADDPGTPPQAVIHPGQRCATPGGAPLTTLTSLGVRTWGDAPDGPTTLLTGTYAMPGEISRRLLEALPPVLVVRDEDWDSPLVGLLAEEIGRDEPGQEPMLDRLLDLLLISVLRTWFARRDDAAPAWYRAHRDPVAGRALRLLQNNPATPWTVTSLAASTGVSRATLARRFAIAVGQPPMAFLAGWRLALAADLLRQRPDATVAAIARQVGYGSAFALSTAFKREYGLSPQQYRRAREELPVTAAGAEPG
ncbi:AraC family transcriptional regulator [Amycolatopsis sp. GM8]|uniref:AraC family transcriptional regulator n=1 Tax=Amycolatopsis sp. GM8 TaxID=2896530 RepID=UPI001F2D6BD2|nr:AraC family transcriptional regulator [Amycolatopsis sp. GM8]